MIKSLIAAIVLALAMPALSGCALTGVPESPGVISDGVVLDEQAADLAEQSYVLAVRAGELAVVAGIIKGETATKIKALDNKAFAILGTIRSAYQASNADGYARAIGELKAVIDQIAAIIKGEPD